VVSGIIFAVPVTFAFIFRMLVMLVLATHVFYMFCTARGMSGTFGFRPGTFVIACLFAMAMLIPLIWAVFVPDLPVYFSQHMIPRRRWERGRCPACGYDRHGLNDSPSCPECGGAFEEPGRWEGGPETVRRFLMLNVLAWVIGCGVGEAWMQIDEHAFRSEVRARAAGGNTAHWSRARRWPNANSSLIFRYPDTFRATE
jgi:hypothetical protein